MNKWTNGKEKSQEKSRGSIRPKLSYRVTEASSACWGPIFGLPVPSSRQKHQLVRVNILDVHLYNLDSGPSLPHRITSPTDATRVYSMRLVITCRIVPRLSSEIRWNENPVWARCLFKEFIRFLCCLRNVDRRHNGIFSIKPNETN